MDATRTKSPQRPQISLRPTMDERLDRLNKLSGLPRVEILERGLNLIEPRIIAAAEALNSPSEQPVAAHAGAT